MPRLTGSGNPIVIELYNGGARSGSKYAAPTRVSVEWIEVQLLPEAGTGVPMDLVISSTLILIFL